MGKYAIRHNSQLCEQFRMLTLRSDRAGRRRRRRRGSLRDPGDGPGEIVRPVDARRVDGDRVGTRVALVKALGGSAGGGHDADCTAVIDPVELRAVEHELPWL